MTTSPSFVAGDTGSKLRVTCKDNDSGDPIDLTDKTIQLQWRNSKGIFVERSMTVIGDATEGKAEYQFAASELEPSIMQFEVEITDAFGKVLRSLDLLSELVREEL